MADKEKDRLNFAMFHTILAARKRRSRRQQSFSIHNLLKRRSITVCILLSLLLCNREVTVVRNPRSCRRLIRNDGWFQTVIDAYTDKRFKKTFRVSKATFSFILNNIKHDLQRETVTENPISPEMRLAICLYRLGRGDYNCTIAEMAGVGTSTVSTIVQDISESIVNNIWDNSVANHFPEDEAQFKEKMLDMEQHWQFPCCWAAVDGCHIPIKCPAGGLEICKEYHNFKNFYSIVLMALVDANYGFIWASCGFLEIYMIVSFCSPPIYGKNYRKDR